MNQNESMPLQNALSGLARGFVVSTLTTPFDTLKVRFQCAEQEKSIIRLAVKMFQSEGIRPFFAGLSAQYGKVFIKQMGYWELIVRAPKFFKSCGMGELSRQAATGVTISTVDAILLTPLEKMRAQAANTGLLKVSLKEIYKDGWKGFSTYWKRQTVAWTVFLVCQKYFRDKASKNGKSLSALDLAVIGVKVAVVASIAVAPFDLENNLEQALGQGRAEMRARAGFLKYYRGWSLTACTLVIHNVASVSLIHWLDR